jgi:hypothetical protein
MKKIIFILISILTIFSGCQYEYEPYFATPEPAIQLQDLTAYSYFKTGTYWIYKDSASGVEDSVYVFYDTAYSYYNTGTTGVDAGNYNFYECRMHSYIDTYNYYYKIDMGYYGRDKVPVWREKFKPGDYVGQSFLMFNSFNPSINLYAYTSPGVITCKNYYDSLNVLGNVFLKAVNFNDTKNASENFSSAFGSINPSTDFYIAKNIGIVKKHIYDTIFNTINKTEYLIRYHIVQ